MTWLCMPGVQQLVPGVLGQVRMAQVIGVRPGAKAELAERELN